MAAPRLLFCLALLAGSLAAQTLSDAQLHAVGFEQNLGGRLPLNLAFRDEAGHVVRLGGYFGSRPVVLVFAYFRCPNLCTVVLNGALECLRNLPWTVGREFEVVVVSIDPSDTPASARAKKQTYALRYGRPGSSAGWHFLTGDSSSIATLTQAAGFRYAYDPASKQFAHASGLLIATPAGQISRYFLGIEYPPKEVRAALAEAAQQKVGGLAERLLLLCFHYNPITGRYARVISWIIQGCGIGTVAALGLLMIHLQRVHRQGAAV